MIDIEAVKRPFPPENVRTKVEEALRKTGDAQPLTLPTEELFARELDALRQLARERGGELVTSVYLGSERHEWWCGKPDHPTWLAEPWRIRRDAWCPSCARNRRLGIDGLRSWGEAVGLELIDNEYHGAGTLYEWRCKKSGHVFRRLYSNIKQSLVKGYPACPLCGDGRAASGLARKKKADEFALFLLQKTRESGSKSLDAIARQLNDGGVATARGTKWYASTVKNVLDRLAQVHSVRMR